MDVLADLDRFYGLIDRVRDQHGGDQRLSTCDARSGWPDRGVYFFFEPGECRSGTTSPRVVRVGTHALRPAKSTLWSRLSHHRGTIAGAMPGGGNHRGSIFRRHVGEALLASGGWPDEICRSWGTGQSAPPEVRAVEYPLERAVTEYIGRMPLLWVGVSDEPSASSERGVIERGVIALLSASARLGIDPPSQEWLGNRADRAVIRQSGLWNVDHVGETHEPRTLAVLDRWIG